MWSSGSGACDTTVLPSQQESLLQRFYHSALTECVLKEKLELLPHYITLRKVWGCLHLASIPDIVCIAV